MSSNTTQGSLAKAAGIPIEEARLMSGADLERAALEKNAGKRKVTGDTMLDAQIAAGEN